MGFFGWLGDAVGWGEGNWNEGWGVGDESGSHQGFLGTGGAGTGGYTWDPNESEAPDYEQIGADSAAKAAERTQGVRDTIAELKQQAQDIPTFTEWMDQEGQSLQSLEDTDAYGGIESLVAQLEAGPTDADYQAGLDNAARLMGLDPAEAEAMMNDLTNQMAGGVEGTVGMSPEEEALRRRQNQSNIRQAEQRARRLVQDSMADSGSTARMLQTADEATAQINNMQLQQDAMLAQEQFERQVAQFESQKQTWQQMLQTNQMSQTQYIQNMQQSMGMAIQGYAQQIQAISQDNQMVLQQYQQDREGMVAQINSLYNAAQLELGVEQAELDMSAELYAQEIQPYLDEIAQYEMEDAANETFGEFFWDTALPAVIEIADIVLPDNPFGLGG